MDCTLLTVMATISPLPTDYSERILCGYVNATRLLQIIRIENISNWYFESIVFPGQRLLFEALPDAKLEIYKCTMASAILSNKLLCEDLRVNEPIPSLF